MTTLAKIYLWNAIIDASILIVRAVCALLHVGRQPTGLFHTVGQAVAFEISGVIIGVLLYYVLSRMAIES